MATESNLNRDEWLRLDDNRLLQQTDQERLRVSGPGGQRRNKVETGIRLHHRPSGITVQATEDRMLDRNRAVALRRLRLQLALQVRHPSPTTEGDLPSELLRYRLPGGGLAVKQSNPDYPLVVAAALDALAAAAGSYAAAAHILGVTTSQLVKFLQEDPEVWRAVASLRE